MEVFEGVLAICVSVGCGNMRGETVVVLVLGSQWQIHEGEAVGVTA